MSSRKVLLLVLEEVPEDEIREAIAERGGDDVNVHVVAPATHISKFQWLTGEEDEARAEAEELADRTAHAVEADAEVEVEVEVEVGERDPVLAVQDALALFPADEILVAGPADEKTEAALRDLGLPISRVGPGGAVGGEEASGAEALARGVAAGKREETPFVVLGSVALIIFAVIALISVVAFLIFWLA
ncbi:MAG: hypothetical protein ACRDNH_13620 [Gaiellaceae bacterium]